MHFDNASIAAIKMDVVKNEITLSFKIRRDVDNQQQADELSIYADPDGGQKVDLSIIPHQLPLKKDTDYKPPSNNDQVEITGADGFIKPIMLLDDPTIMEGEMSEIQDGDKEVSPMEEELGDE